MFYQENLLLINCVKFYAGIEPRVISVSPAASYTFRVELSPRAPWRISARRNAANASRNERLTRVGMCEEMRRREGKMPTEPTARRSRKPADQPVDRCSAAAFPRYLTKLYSRCVLSIGYTFPGHCGVSLFSIATESLFRSPDFAPEESIAGRHKREATMGSAVSGTCR